MSRVSFKAVAQLVRLPNVFTAWGDIALAAFATGAWAEQPVAVVLLILATTGLYLSGMAFNDYFDRESDARTQAFRPIPSGRVTPGLARLLATALMLAGIVSALAATLLAHGREFAVPPVAVAAILAGVITLYNAWLKHTPLGPLAMGTCRALNVGLGLSLAIPERELALVLMGTVGLYIVGVTWFARTEETTSSPRKLMLALGVVTLAGLLAATLPGVTGSSPTRLYPYLLAAWGLYVSGPALAAVAEPSPRRVQLAVKRLIFGLIPLDAVLATGVAGLPGLAILMLLVPSTLLGRRVYST